MSERADTPDEMDQAARHFGWLILQPGQAYMRQFSYVGQAFLFEDEDGWIAWAGWFHKGESKAFKEKFYARRTNFRTALSKANKQLAWYAKQR